MDKNLKIIHLADIHIHNSTKRYNEYQNVFNNLYKYIEKVNPDRIVISGDLFQDYVAVNNEAKTFAGEFLKKLSTYCKIILTPGNHDLMKKNRNRITSPKVVVELMDNENILYLEESGFFEDDNIVWVNYSHLQKEIFPWSDIKHKKDDSKVYIGLFHDPVYGCKLPNGESMDKKSLVNLKTFENDDCVMLGDIHLRQYLKDNIAYSGSLIQQSFGEKPYGHGGILWNIDDNKNITSEDFDIENKWVYINHIIDQIDYDNIEIEKSEYSTVNTYVKIQWKDYSVNINLDNEIKIKKYFSNLYNIDEESIKFKRIYLNDSIINNTQLNESINLNDKKQLQKIFESYLKDNGYKKEQIKELIKLDDIISDRLDLKIMEKNIEWKILGFWFENFKSYDKAVIEWSDKKGIFQISGGNQQGKTTILDAITYILFGTTLSTHTIGGAKREKYGDSRYINNKKNVNFCSGGMKIQLGNETIIMERRTDREINKNGKISSVTTNINFYNDEIKEENKQNEEQKKDTQKKIDSYLGDFEDFIRLTLTNAENLNTLLSLDRAKFIDSIIKDAGYDIFEKKLEEFKEYKKDKLKNRIDIDIDEKEHELKERNNDVNLINFNMKNLVGEISEIKENISNIEKDKENQIKMLNKVDEKISQINITDLNQKITDYNSLISKSISKIKKNKDNMINLKSTYDKEKYEKLYLDIKNINETNVDLKLKISEYENRIERENSNIEKVDLRMEQIVNNEIDNLKRKIHDIHLEIQDMRKSFDVKFEKIKDKYRNKINENTYTIKGIENEINIIKNNGKSIKKEIKKIEEDLVCPTCGQEYDEKHKVHRNNVIQEKNKELNILLENAKEKINIIKEIKEKNNKIESRILDLEEGIYKSDLLDSYNGMKSEIEVKDIIISDIEKEISKLDNKNIKETSLYEKFLDGEKIKEKSNSIIDECNKKIVENKEEIETNKINVEKLEKEKLTIDREKEQYDTYKILERENSELSLKMENIKLNIENAQVKIEQYNNQIENINKNKLINQKISELKTILEDKNEELEDKEEQYNKYREKLVIKNKDIVNISKDIEAYKIQIKMEELFKEYMKINHRDGIPTYLLKQSISLLNSQMDEMLEDVDFKSFFDDDLKLKMYPRNNTKSIINALESSGKERTFIALSLKMALRNINMNSRSNIFLIDEAMGKLANESVDEFMKFLEILKKNIEKILIIEHNHTVNYDYIINVHKNEKGISTLEFK
jgi:DNA repair exonuclease SbcCD ATPase subunit